MTTGKSKERKNRIDKASMLTLREIISDGMFELDFRTPLRKLIGTELTPKKCVFCKISEKLVRANVPSILPL